MPPIPGTGSSLPPFAHVVVLMLENRSFDHVLGSLGRDGLVDLDGGSPDMTNADLHGQPVGLSPAAQALSPDLPHDFASVATALAGPNQGFVVADQLFHKGSPDADPRRVMSFFPPGALPWSHALAQAYAVCDRWFCSVPSETWPNRLFAVSATSEGRVTNTLPFLGYDMPTVFDRLPGHEWVVYNDQIPLITVNRHLALNWLEHRHDPKGNFRSLAQFEADCAAGHLPRLAFIEPDYLGSGGDDAHPPHSVAASEALIGRVYAAVRGSSLWPKTLLAVVYDEHGGLFDHVPPPINVPSPDDHPGEIGFSFGRLGPRVPCLLVSPWLEARTVVRPPEGRFADHTSLIATLLRRWGLAPLTARDQAAWDLLGLPWLPQAREDSMPEPPAPPMLAAALPGDPLDPTALEGLSGLEVARRVAEPAAIRDTAGQPMTMRAPTTAAETGEPRALTLEESLHLLATALPKFAEGSPR